MKSLIKELIIILLLTIIIGLILCIIFYNYLPFNKIVPSKVEAYVTPGTVKEEINEDIVEYPKQNIVFEITDSDLTLYKQSQSYDPGKSNPFEVYKEPEKTNTESGNNGNNTVGRTDDKTNTGKNDVQASDNKVENTVDKSSSFYTKDTSSGKD